MLFRGTIIAWNIRDRPKVIKRLPTTYAMIRTRFSTLIYLMLFRGTIITWKIRNGPKVIKRLSTAFTIEFHFLLLMMLIFSFRF